MLTIRTRKSWGARKPRPRSPQNPDNIGELFIHWNGSTPASFRSVDTQGEERSLMRSTQDFHMDTRGWSDFAYSFAIMPSGRCYRGRGLHWVPASQLGHNTNTASCIVFLGPEDAISDRVKQTVRGLHRYVASRSERSVALRAHRDATPTECPGAALTAMVRDLA